MYPQTNTPLLEALRTDIHFLTDLLHWHIALCQLMMLSESTGIVSMHEWFMAITGNGVLIVAKEAKKTNYGSVLSRP